MMRRIWRGILPVWTPASGGARPSWDVRRPMLVIAAALVLILLVATGIERWTLWQEQQAVARAQAQNAQLQRDIAQTRQAVTLAQQPAMIEREARRLGYIRPGDTPIIVVTHQP